MAFATPIRGRMIYRRRVQMAVYVSIFGALLIAAISAATLPSAYPYSWQTIVTNGALIYIAVILIYLSFYQAIGWMDFERIIGPVPLTPDRDHASYQVSVETREIMHEINNQMMELVGCIDLSADQPDISPETVSRLERASNLAVSVCELQSQAQILIRSLSVEPTQEREDV